MHNTLKKRFFFSKVNNYFHINLNDTKFPYNYNHETNKKDNQSYKINLKEKKRQNHHYET